MDLDEMKVTWMQLSADMDSQKKLTKELILKMAHQKSSRSIGNLKRFEALGGILMGTVITIGTVYYTFIGTFQSIPLVICAILSILLFLTSMGASGRFILIMSQMDLLKNSIEESQENFLKFKNYLVWYQRINFYSVIPAMLFFIPVVLKVFNSIDIFTQFDEGKEKLLAILFCSFLLAIPVLFLLFRFYKKNVKDTFEAHEELEKD